MHGRPKPAAESALGQGVPSAVRNALVMKGFCLKARGGRPLIGVAEVEGMSRTRFPLCEDPTAPAAHAKDGPARSLRIATIAQVVS